MDEQTLNFIKQMVMRGMLLADQGRAVAHDRALPRGEYREVPVQYSPEEKHSLVVQHLKKRYGLNDEQAQQGAQTIMAGTHPNDRAMRGEAFGHLPRTQFQYQPTREESFNPHTIETRPPGDPDRARGITIRSDNTWGR